MYILHTLRTVVVWLNWSQKYVKNFCRIWTTVNFFLAKIEKTSGYWYIMYRFQLPLKLIWWVFYHSFWTKSIITTFFFFFSFEEIFLWWKLTTVFIFTFFFIVYFWTKMFLVVCNLIDWFDHAKKVQNVS